MVLLGQGDGHSLTNRSCSPVVLGESQCVLKDFATPVKDDVFAPTPSPLSVRGFLLYTAWFDLRLENGDLVCAFMQADTSSETYARPLKGQEREGWIWRLHGAVNGMRTASSDFTEFLAGILTEHMGFKRGKLERCLLVHVSNETRVVSHVEPLICAKPATLVKLDAYHRVGSDQEKHSIRAYSVVYL